MKKTLRRVITAASLAVFTQAASAAVLLTDNFTVTSNSQNVNQELAGRQTGPLAPSQYTGVHVHHQVGNAGTDVGQPGGAANKDYVLLAFDGSFFSDVNLAAVANGPLTIEFDMYLRGSNPGGAPADSWVACAVRSPGEMFPVCDAGEFAFLVRANGGVQVFQNGDGGTNTPPAWTAPGFAMADHWTLIFSDTAGTGSAFNGNGSKVTMINGTNTLGTLPLGQLKSAGLVVGFRDNGNRFGGIDNFSISGTPSGIVAGKNLSFEYDTTPPGTSLPAVPTSWTPFNEGGWADFGSQNASNTVYSVNNPLGAPADGNQFCYINMFNGGGVGGLYQDMGPIQSNTIYTLTVAIGSRGDRINSPGIIQLINGTDNTGPVLASTTGLTDSMDSWQDFTISYTNGASANGDITVVLAAQGDVTIQANFDNVRLTTAPAPVAIPPNLLTDVRPLKSRVATGAPVTFSVTANGSAPLHYQWFNQGGPISGATGSSYTFNAVSGVTDYYVTVTNSAGAISSSTAEVISATNIVTINNFSFEDGTHTGGGGKVIPLQWSDFNNNNFSAVASNSFSVVNPLAPPADGNQFFAINEGPADPTGGIYQDVGSLQPNTVYTLTVAIGRRGDTSPGNGEWSPGTLTLINGTDNTGVVLASVTGHPDAQDSWQDFTVTFTNGALASGHLTVALSVAPADTFQGMFDNVRLTADPVTVAIPPTIVTDVRPLRSRVATGTPLSFSVTANGSAPLHYQWFNQGGPISGATGSTYSFNAVAGTNDYHVTVTNSAGSVSSSTTEVISSPHIVTVNNFSFEEGTHSGANGKVIPILWSDFNNNNFSAVASNSFSIVNPLAPPADGNFFFAINEGPSDPTGGIYQDVGTLLPNTTYTLTVAIGRRADTGPGSGDWSPGTFSLINGTDNTGVVLATTTGHPDSQDSWQDYSTTFTTGPSVSGHLTVALSVAPAGTFQGVFDNVRLSKAAPFRFDAPYISGGNLILTASGGTANGGYTLLTTASLSTPVVWTTNSTGTLNGAGAFSNAVPITGNPPRFFRLRSP